MKTFVRCGQLFTGREDAACPGGILSFDERGMIDYAGPETEAPRRTRGGRTLDYSECFVMPGLIDVHTHLAYGNAKSEEDIDLYSPLEFRALRGMFFAQKVAAAGFTAICSPGDAGQISLIKHYCLTDVAQTAFVLLRNIAGVLLFPSSRR